MSELKIKEIVRLYLSTMNKALPQWDGMGYIHWTGSHSHGA